MGNREISVNPANPGQHLACMGLLYCASHLDKTSTGRFDGQNFILKSGHDDPLAAVLDALSECRVEPVMRNGQADRLDPARLIGHESSDGLGLDIYVDFWSHFDHERATIKLLASKHTGAGILKKWLERIKCRADDFIRAGSPLHVSETGLPTGFDTDTMWSARKNGYSLNEHKHNKNVVVYPMIEFFAQMGAQVNGMDPQGGNIFHYWTWPSALPLSLARIAAAGLLQFQKGENTRHVFQIVDVGQGKKALNVPYGFP